jgi:hypothetical protein
VLLSIGTRGSRLACQFTSYFNTLESASLFSQLCGVLAALTFSALVGGLASEVQVHRGSDDSVGTKHPKESFSDPQAYRALLLAFVVLLFSSALWALVSGAVDSARSRLMVIVAVWMTVLGTLLMLIALISFIGQAWPENSKIGSKREIVGSPRTTAVTVFRLVALFGSVTVWVATTDALGVWGGVSWYSSWMAVATVIAISLSAIAMSSTELFNRLSMGFDYVVTISMGFAAILILGFGYLASVNGKGSVFVQEFCNGGLHWWWISLLLLPTLLIIGISAAFNRSLKR